MIDLLFFACADALIYFGLVLSLWISFRILAYPDLSIEQTFVLGTAIFSTLAVRGNAVVSLPFLLLAIALVMGFACSFLRNTARISAVLVSLLAGYVYYSLSLTVLGGPNCFFADKLARLQTPVILALLTSVYAIIIAVLAFISRCNVGLKIIASGCNWDLAKRHRLRPNLSYALGLSAAFFCSLMAGAFHAWRSGYSDVGSGRGLLLTSIFVVLVTRGLQRHIRPTANAVVLFAILVGYLVVLQLALRAGLSPQWIRGATALCLLLALLILPRRVQDNLALRL